MMAYILHITKKYVWQSSYLIGGVMTPPYEQYYAKLQFIHFLSTMIQPNAYICKKNLSVHKLPRNSLQIVHPKS